MTAKHEETVLKLLEGAYDLHAHAAPSHVTRGLDDFELIREAGQAGMAGVLLKCHYEPTAARAEIANKYAGAAPATLYGSITLNWPVGGLNPFAAESGLKMGAKFVWMPTKDTAHCLSFGNMHGDFLVRPGISVLTEAGRVKKEVLEILEITKKYGACLGTGHISPQESVALARAAHEMGAKVALTHPEWTRTRVPLNEQVEMAKNGALIEKCWINVRDGSSSAEELAEGVRAIGPERIFMTTDRGQINVERPVEAMKMFMEAMLEQGVSADDIRTMVRTVPETMLALY